MTNIEIEERLKTAPNVIIINHDINNLNVIAVDSAIKHQIEIKTKSWDL